MKIHTGQHLNLIHSYAENLAAIQEGQLKLNHAINKTPYLTSSWYDAFTAFVNSTQSPSDLHEAANSFNFLSVDEIKSNLQELGTFGLTKEKEPNMEHEPAEFTASNGIKIKTTQDGYLTGEEDYGDGPMHTVVNPDGIDALREYFQHNRDKELGRWRDPENPDHLVYRRDPYVQGYRRIAVVNERDMTSVHEFSEGSEKGSSDPKALTAQRYFAENLKPIPEWHESKPGEAWLLYLDGRIEPQVGLRVRDFFFETTDSFLHPTNPRITHATRIWPEEN